MSSSGIRARSATSRRAGSSSSDRSRHLQRLADALEHRDLFRLLRLEVAHDVGLLAVHQVLLLVHAALHLRVIHPAAAGKRAVCDALGAAAHVREALEVHEVALGVWLLSPL